jgi:hypothetical protein
MAVMTDDERRDFHRKSRRRETLAMVIQGATVVMAVASFALWAAGRTVLTPAWVIISALLAVGNIYAQRTIRLLREANRDAQEHLRWVQDQRHATAEDPMRKLS